MREEILDAMRLMISELVPGPVVIGSLPPLGGYAVGFAGGAPLATFWPLTTNEGLPVSFTGKDANQADLAREMEAVHRALTTAHVLPHTDRWQVYAIVTTSAPQPIGREENLNWIYGSSFRVKFYAKGAENG